MSFFIDKKQFHDLWRIDQMEGMLQQTSLRRVGLEMYHSFYEGWERWYMPNIFSSLSVFFQCDEWVYKAVLASQIISYFKIIAVGTGKMTQCFRALGTHAQNLNFAQFTYRSSEQPVTLVPGDWTPAFMSNGQAHIRYTYMHIGKTLIYIK